MDHEPKFQLVKSSIYGFCQPSLIINNVSHRYMIMALLTNILVGIAKLINIHNYLTQRCGCSLSDRHTPMQLNWDSSAVMQVNFCSHNGISHLFVFSPPARAHILNLFWRVFQSSGDSFRKMKRAKSCSEQMKEKVVPLKHFKMTKEEKLKGNKNLL